jgi:hypothetical protein
MKGYKGFPQLDAAKLLIRITQREEAHFTAKNGRGPGAAV